MFRPLYSLPYSPPHPPTQLLNKSSWVDPTKVRTRGGAEYQVWHNYSRTLYDEIWWPLNTEVRHGNRMQIFCSPVTKLKWNTGFSSPSILSQYLFSRPSVNTASSRSACWLAQRYEQLTHISGLAFRQFCVHAVTKPPHFILQHFPHSKNCAIKHLKDK